MGDFIWLREKTYAFLNETKRTTPSETLGKRTIVLHGNKGKLTTVLDS